LRKALQARVADSKVLKFALLSLAFLFRLAFGVCSPLFTASEDEKQIYLIGLKFFTTHAWPWFGPDVTNTIQIPGALQGLLVGLPFFVLPIPEAPFVFLNILAFASLCFLAWYFAKRLPDVPAWVIYAWLLTAPWTMNLSTNIYNPSYVLTGSILFFVGALETYPFLTIKVISLRWANLMMGVGLLWVMQLHLSWIVLVPFVALSFYFQIKELGMKAFAAVLWFLIGTMMIGSLVIPTFWRYGSSAGIDAAMRFNSANLFSYWNIAEGIPGRFLSFASFEIPRFIGNNTATRLAFLKANPWLIPFAIVLTIVGFLQPLSLIILWFRKNQRNDWKAIKYLALGTVLLLHIAFLFSAKSPLSHTFYLTLPIAMLFAFYCWSRFLSQRFWQRFAAFGIACGIIFHAGLAVNNYSKSSLYIDRNKVSEAIRDRDYRIMGERRAGAKY
jgi:hypothetical protein